MPVEPDRRDVPEPATGGPRRILAALRDSGTFAVAVGLLVLGLSSYGFLTVGAHGVSTADFSVVAVLWSALFALANGLFNPLEQEATRAVAERVSRGEGIGPVVRRVGALGAGIAAAVCLVLLLARHVLARAVFDGQESMVGLLAVGLVAAGGAFVGRGVLAGCRRYRSYAAQLAADGLLRVLVAAVLVVAGHATATGLGIAMTAPSWLVLVVLVAALPRPRGRHRPCGWNEVSANLGWLMLAATFSYGVSNAGPIVLRLVGDHDPGLAGRFLATFVVVRIPVFFSSALQASFLPKLVEAVESGDRTSFVATLGRAMGLIAGLGALSLAGFAAIGPWLVSLLFGARYSASRTDLVALGLSSVLLVMATMLQSAVLALGGHRVVAGCWVAGGLIFAAICVLPVPPIARLELAYALSTAVVGALLAVRLLRGAPRMPVVHRRRPGSGSPRPAATR